MIYLYNLYNLLIYMDINRFIEAHNKGYNGWTSTFETAFKEIQNYKKETHWIWYIFPQIKGLIEKPSEISEKFSIQSINEAIIFLRNNIVGNNLIKITKLLLKSPNNINIRDIFGNDDIKLLSSMTLFSYIHKLIYKNKENIF